MEVFAVKHLDAFLDVAEPNAVVIDPSDLFGGNTSPVVSDLDPETPVVERPMNADRSAFELRLDSVLDAVLDQRLKQHARHQRVESGVLNFLDHLQLLAEAYA